MNEIDSVFACGAKNVSANVDLVHVIVSFHNLVHVCGPESVHAGVGSDRGGLTVEGHLVLANLDFLLASTGLQLSLSPGVEVHGCEADKELEHSNSGVPPSGEHIAVSSVVGKIDLSRGPSREEHQLDHKGHKDHVFVEPECAKEQAEGASEASSEPVTRHALVHHSVLVSGGEFPGGCHHWWHAVDVSVVEQREFVGASVVVNIFHRCGVSAGHHFISRVTGCGSPDVIFSGCHRHGQVAVHGVL